MMRCWQWSYARHVPIAPNDGSAHVEEVFQLNHGDDGVENKTKEMGEGIVRNAIRCPWTMMVHLRYTSWVVFSEEHDERLELAHTADMTCSGEPWEAWLHCTFCTIVVGQTTLATHHLSLHWKEG